jgi:hypothetical protein
MLKNARGEDGHQSPEDDSTDSDSNQLRGEQLNNLWMSSCFQFLCTSLTIRNGRNYTPVDTAQEDASIKRASLVVFNVMNRMPQTILEFAAAAKASAEKWKHMPCQTAAESQDLFRMMEKGAATRRATQWMMDYLEVLAKLQNRPTSQAGKRSMQAFVETECLSR